MYIVLYDNQIVSLHQELTKTYCNSNVQMILQDFTQVHLIPEECSEQPRAQEGDAYEDPESPVERVQEGEDGSLLGFLCHQDGESKVHPRFSKVHCFLTIVTDCDRSHGNVRLL